MSDDQTPAETPAEAAPDAGADELAALRAEVASLKEQMLRVAADAENAKRRAERDANDARAYAIQKFARDLLGAADNLSRAVAAAPADAAEAAVKNFVIGVQMTEKELQGAFEKNGLKRIEPARGEKFDPHKHQAMMEEVSAEVAAGGVINVMAAGYELLGRLVRPAMVVVAAKGSTGPTPEGEAPAAAAANPYANSASEAESGDAVDRRA
jgi:molecular chaperone GrpE